MNWIFLKSMLYLFVTGMCVSGLEAQNITLNDSLLKKVESSRKLTFKKPPSALILPEEKFKERISFLLKLQVPASRLSMEESIFKMLFFIPVSYPYVKCLSDAMNQRALALYDFTSKKLIIKKGYEHDEEILSHELIHALQDQHFNLSRTQLLLNESTNRGLAIASMLEGDALLHQLSPDKKNTRSTTQALTPCTPPDTLNSLFLVPYEFGRTKVAKIINDDSLQSFNKLLAHPVPSSNYLYLGMKAPPQSIAHMSRTGFEDSLGPLFYKIFLQKNNPTHESLLAIRGMSYDKVTLEKNTLSSVVNFLTEESMQYFWNCLLAHFSKELLIPINQNAKIIKLKVNNTTLTLHLNEKHRSIRYFINETL